MNELQLQIIYRSWLLRRGRERSKKRRRSENTDHTHKINFTLLWPLWPLSTLILVISQHSKPVSPRLYDSRRIISIKKILINK